MIFQFMAEQLNRCGIAAFPHPLPQLRIGMDQIVSVDNPLHGRPISVEIKNGRGFFIRIVFRFFQAFFKQLIQFFTTPVFFGQFLLKLLLGS